MESVIVQPYELTFEERRGYLYACVRAPRVIGGMAFNYLAEIADKCAAIDCKRLLIERDVPAPPTNHAYAAINDFVGMRDGRPVAFVNLHDGSVGQALRTQIEAAAACGQHAAYFTDIATAEAWLLAR